LRALRGALLFGPPLAFHALLFYLSSQRRLPAGPEGADKVLHFLAYFFLALLWIRGFGGGRIRVTSAQALAAFAITALFGLTDEIHQSFVPGRSASGWDLLADTLGAAAAAVVGHVRGRDRSVDPQL
jgi:VanZ family protein